MIPADLPHSVAHALAEDIGAGDLSAALIDPGQLGHARIVTKEPGVICGRPYVQAVFEQLPGWVEITWHVEEGEMVDAGRVLCELNGYSHTLLSGERTALNFLQTLSGVATVTRQFVNAVAGTRARILDTRKTLPGLRLAQKYAVRVGGGHNHRLGLYDGVLIKENHISAAGGIPPAVERARSLTPLLTRIEVEVENLDELAQALEAGADLILLDNFSLGELRRAVALVAGRVPLEASGNVTLETVRAVADTGVDYISVGSLTRNVRSLDLSMRFTGKF